MTINVNSTTWTLNKQWDSGSKRDNKLYSPIETRILMRYFISRIVSDIVNFTSCHVDARHIGTTYPRCLHNNSFCTRWAIWGITNDSLVDRNTKNNECVRLLNKLISQKCSHHAMDPFCSHSLLKMTCRWSRGTVLNSGGRDANCYSETWGNRR